MVKPVVATGRQAVGWEAEAQLPHVVRGTAHGAPPHRLERTGAAPDESVDAMCGGSDTREL